MAYYLVKDHSIEMTDNATINLSSWANVLLRKGINGQNNDLNLIAV